MTTQDIRDIRENKDKVQKSTRTDINPAYIDYWIDRILAIGKRQWLPIEMPEKYRPNIKQPIINTTIDDFDPDTYKFSNEVPANKSFIAMGLVDTDHNEHLDCSEEGRYLREYCVQRGNTNNFLHFRTLTDLRSQNQQTDPEVLMTILEDIELTYDIAVKWAEANRSLEIDRKRFLKTVHVEMKGMCLQCVIRYIENLEQLAESADEVTITWINYINSADVEKEYLTQYFQAMPNIADSEEDWEDFEEQFSTQPYADGLDRKNSTNPYSTNRLFNGTETLTHEFVGKIKHAQIKDINDMQSKMFPQQRTYTEIQNIKHYFQQKFGTCPQIKSSNKKTKPLWKKGKPVYDDYGQLVMIPAVSTGLKYKPPYYSHFTSGMVSHFWTLIKLRKEELNKEVVDDDDLSADAMTAISWIRQLGKGQVTTTLINNAITGTKMNVYGIKVDFNNELDQKEANTLWQTYKAM